MQKTNSVEGLKCDLEKLQHLTDALVPDLSQINVFPVIEKYRSSFIKKHKDAIQKALPVSNSYGQKVTTPEEVEIGMLIYMVGNQLIHVSSSEYQEMECFRDARNKLAHLNVIDFGSADLILRKAEAL